MRKLLCISVCVCMLAAFLTGCTGDANTLWTAYQKTADAASYSAEQTITMNFTGTRIYSDDTVNALLHLLNGLTLHMTSDYVKNDDGLKVAAVADTSFLGQELSFGVWVDGAGQFIIGTPKGTLPLDREYLTVSGAQNGLDLAALDSAALLEQLDPTGIEVVKNGDTYDVTVDKAGLATLIEQYIQIVAALTGEVSDADMDEAFKMIADAGIFGDGGVKASYTIGADGYLAESTEAFDLVLDLAKLGGATEDVVVIGFEITTKYTNYNQVADFDLPVISGDNALDFMSYMLLSTIHNTGDDVSVILDGAVLDFDVQPRTVNDRTMVPMRTIFESLGAVVNYDEETETVFARSDAVTLVHKIGDKVLYVNGDPVEMDVESFEEDGRTLVPVRFVSQALGARVDWVEANQVVLITK
ncbi:hypothetical protein FACS189492_1600 [Clostridia bacterium]|nr:hypothetical protein FACS189492_1600 [Clostridia bacterium]